MSTLYVYENGSEIYHDSDQIVIKSKNIIRKIPIERLSHLILFSRVNIKTSTIRVCMKNGISMTWLSKTGKFYGKLFSSSHIMIKKQRMQFKLGENSAFKLNFAKKIIEAKINNQKVVLQRISRMQNKDVSDNIKMIKILNSKVKNAKSIQEILGYEGNASKNYFEGLSNVIPENFKFKGRSKRPPKDAFNSLISFGYTLLMYEIYSVIEIQGLNPYAGFMHRDKENHPTLASDLMEEWRPVLIDYLVLHLIIEEKITVNMFNITESGVFISKEGIKIFIKEYERRLLVKSNYLNYLEHKTSFRKGIMHQVENLSKCLLNENLDDLYPVHIK